MRRGVRRPPGPIRRPARAMRRPMPRVVGSPGIGIRIPGPIACSYFRFVRGHPRLLSFAVSVPTLRGCGLARQSGFLENPSDVQRLGDPISNRRGCRPRRIYNHSLGIGRFLVRKRHLAVFTCGTIDLSSLYVSAGQRPKINRSKNKSKAKDRQPHLGPRVHDAVSACPVRSRPKVAANPDPFHSWRPAT